MPSHMEKSTINILLYPLAKQLIDLWLPEEPDDLAERNISGDNPRLAKPVLKNVCEYELGKIWNLV